MKTNLLAIALLYFAKKEELSLKFLEEALEANSDLESEFGYFFPVDTRDADIERIIQQYKK